jgi:hypothetical protein
MKIVEPYTKGLTRCRAPRTRAIRPIRTDGDLAYILLQNGQEAVIDVEDVPLVEGRNWLFLKIGYAATRETYNYKDYTYYLHRIVLRNPPSPQIDHISGNKLDCRKTNLRPCAAAQNLLNRVSNKNNKSGHRGVSWCKRENVWEATIGLNYETIHLGRFKRIEDAVAAREEAVKQLHGEFAPRNRG